LGTGTFPVSRRDAFSPQRKAGAGVPGRKESENERGKKLVEGLGAVRPWRNASNVSLNGGSWGTWMGVVFFFYRVVRED